MNSDITWEDPYCAEGNNCFRIGTDTTGNAYIAVAGQEDTPSPTPTKPSAPSSSKSRLGKPTTCCRPDGDHRHQRERREERPLRQSPEPLAAPRLVDVALGDGLLEVAAQAEGVVGVGEVPEDRGHRGHVLDAETGRRGEAGRLRPMVAFRTAYPVV